MKKWKVSHGFQPCDCSSEPQSWRKKINLQMLSYFLVRIGPQLYLCKKILILRTDLSKDIKVPDKMEGAKCHKKNISEKEFFTRIMRNSVTHFTLKSYLPPTLLQNQGTVHIFLPSVPSSRIIHRLEISFLQLVEHSRS